MGKGMVLRGGLRAGIFAAAVLSLCCARAGADDDVFLDKIVVTPSRLEEPAGGVSGDVEVVSSYDLEAKGDVSAADSLSDITGLDVIGGGRFGPAAEGVYIRGAQTRHTAYMFEGIKLYDPSNTSAYYVPSDFLTYGLSRIEVVKTPLSALYGSSPMGGAVSFIPKEPKGKPYFSYESEGGSYSTSRETAEVGGKTHELSYLFNVARLDSDGFPKARKRDSGAEGDPYQDTNITMNLAYTPLEDLKIGMATKAIHSRTKNADDNDYDGVPEEDPDNFSWNNEFVGTLYAQKAFTPMLSYKIQGGTTSIFRRYQDDNDGTNVSDNYMRAWYEGRTYQFLNSFEVTPFDFYKAQLGFDYTKEIADSYRYDYSNAFAFGFESDFPKKSIHSRGFFIENIVTPFDGFETNFSYRLEQHPIFKNHSVIKGKTSYTIPGVKTQVYGSYSEGFKAPSLYQLYDPARGNLSLRPEESRTWEVGLTQPFTDKVSATISYFHSDFKNLIDFVYTNPLFWIGRFVNSSRARSSGVEFEARYSPLERLKLRAGYSFLKGSQDFVDEDFVTVFSHNLIRTPRNKAFIEAEWGYKKLDTTVELSYVGRRTDRIWTSVGFVSFDQFLPMKAYVLANVTFNYKLADNKSLFLKLHNIFDRDYELIKGYQEERASVYGGFKLKF